MIRAIKCFVQVILVMAITACSANRMQSDATFNLKRAEDQVNLATQMKFEQKHNVAKVYIERANEFINAANKARTNNNALLANQYALLAVSETQVAMAALEATGKQFPSGVSK